MNGTPNPPPHQPGERFTVADRGAFARLLSGVAPESVDLELLSGPGRQVFGEVARTANGAGTTAAFERVIADYPDKEQILLSVLRADPNAPPAEVKPPRFRLIPARDMLAREHPKALVGGLFYLDSIAALTGSHGTGKSFLALDAALSIAADLRFLGREVIQGPTVYIVGEGGSGLRQRLEAWQIARGTEIPDSCYFIENMPQLADLQDVTELLAIIAAMPVKPVLTVFDTLSRAMVGREENSSKDMSLVVAAAEAIKRATGSCVMFLHHLSRVGQTIRGHTSLPAGIDTEIKLDRVKGANLITLSCEKMKDGPEFESFHLVTRQVPLQGARSSLVLDPAEQTVVSMSDFDSQVLKLLRETFGAMGATTSNWQRVCDEHKVSRTSYYRALDKLSGLDHLRCRKVGRSITYWPKELAPADAISPKELVRPEREVAE